MKKFLLIGIFILLSGCGFSPLSQPEPTAKKVYKPTPTEIEITQKTASIPIVEFQNELIYFKHPESILQYNNCEPVPIRIVKTKDLLEIANDNIAPDCSSLAISSGISIYYRQIQTQHEGIDFLKEVIPTNCLFTTKSELNDSDPNAVNQFVLDPESCSQEEFESAARNIRYSSKTGTLLVTPIPSPNPEFNYLSTPELKAQASQGSYTFPDKLIYKSLKF
jgi:hypothetical protein